MNNRIYRLTALCALAALMLFSAACKQKAKPRKSKYDNMAKLMEREFRLARDPNLNTVPTERLLEAREFRNQKLQMMLMRRTAVPGINWQERGANNVGGRTRALLFDKADAVNGYKKVWAAGVSGGLWFTNDITAANPVWVKVNDLFDNLVIGAIVQSSINPQIMYFGTGEGWFNVDAGQGAGIWKSVDGGNNWTRLNSTQTFYYVQDLLLDNSDNLYAAVRPNNLSLGAHGIQKSEDGGATWATVLSSPDASSNRGGDLELAANGDIYAAMGTVGSNGGIYRSSSAAHTTNTGDAGTWTNITPDEAGAIETPDSTWHRIELACAPSNASVVYALMEGFGSVDCSSIQQYNSATNTWTVRTVPTIVDQGDNSVFTRGQAFYDLIAAVDPNNANSLYIGGIDALRSDNNGQTWTQMTTWSLFGATGFTPAQNVHADHHAIVFAPGSSQRALWGTDGGIYYTANANVTGVNNKPSFTSKNNGYNVTQYYSAAIHPTLTNYFLAGAQDNGSHQFTGSGMNNVEEVSGGDGGFCHIDQDNPAIQITSYTQNNYFVSTDGGVSFNPQFLNSRGDFINASDYASTENILYAGDNAGRYFRWTNPHNTAIDLQDQVVVSQFGAASVSHVAVSPVTPSRVFFGLGNGAIVRVDNANIGTSRTGVVMKAANGNNVSCIAIDPANEDHILVTYSNYGVVNVYETINGLSAAPTWTSVEGDLPDMPVRWAMFDPRNSDWALLATELGVWSTNNLNPAGTTSWNPTNSGLANVRVDMLKMRSSDKTIIAATHGRGLFTAVVPTTITPDINFTAGSTAAEESVAGNDGCRTYRDYTVNLTIANPPSGNANVQVNVQSSTATRGVDFDYTTNGNLSSPSTAVIFEGGVAEAKSILVRIYNDAEVESIENIVFNYTISGSTDAIPGSGAQTHTVNIADNDVAPVAFSSQQYTVGLQQFYLPGFPFNSSLQSRRNLILYKASELVVAGITPGNISSIGFNLQKSSTRPYTNLRLKMGTTSLNYLIDGGSAMLVSTTTVKSVPSYNTVNGWNVFELDAPFTWNGTDNIAIEVCYDNVTADAASLGDNAVSYSDGGSETQGSVFFQNNINCNTSFSSVQYFNEGAKPELRIGKTVIGTNVETAVSSRSEFFARTNDFYIYNNNGNIIARLRNLSGTHDYGCTSVQIDRAGTGATNFWNTSPAARIMDKTFRVVPGSNNPTGSYEITLYFTEQEVEGWEAATGHSFENIQLIKTEGRVSDVTPTDPSAAGAVSMVTPVVGNFGEHRTLTYTFHNGFSGFGAGIPGAALPVHLLHFTAKNSPKGVLLEWKTAFEENSTGFEIERSFDGNRFEKIGFVASKGNTSTGHRYDFIDRSVLKEKNYYRLKQLDIDHRFEYSTVLMVRSELSKLNEMKVLQNPFTNYIHISFAQAPGEAINIALSDITGKTVLEYKSPDGIKQLRIPVKQLTSGTYILNVQVGKQRFVEKVVKN